MNQQAARLADLCQRLAETQQNLPVPLTNDERLELRETAKLLRSMIGPRPPYDTPKKRKI